MVPHQQSSKNTIKVSSIQSSENWWHIYFRVELEFGGCDIDAVLVQVFLRRRRHLINTRAVMEEHKGLCSKSQASISALRCSVYLLCAALIWTESSFISQLAFLFRCDVFFFFLIVLVFFYHFNSELQLDNKDNNLSCKQIAQHSIKPDLKCAVAARSTLARQQILTLACAALFIYLFSNCQ